MKKYLPNISVFVSILLFTLLGQSGQIDFVQKTSALANELVSELIIVFIGITVGLFIKDFISALIGASIIASGAFACVYFGFFVNITYELILAEFIVIMGFAAISNLHNIQKANQFNI